MGTSYWIESIELPPGKLAEVNRLLEEHDVKRVFHISQGEHIDGALLEMDDPYMGYSTAEDVDEFLDDLAGVLKGTPEDGQIVKYDHEESGGSACHVFADGQRHDCGYEPMVLRGGVDCAAGESKVVSVKVRILGLSKGVALIRELVAPEHKAVKKRPRRVNENARIDAAIRTVL